MHKILGFQQFQKDENIMFVHMLDVMTKCLGMENTMLKEGSGGFGDVYFYKMFVIFETFWKFKYSKCMNREVGDFFSSFFFFFCCPLPLRGDFSFDMNAGTVSEH